MFFGMTENIFPGGYSAWSRRRWVAWPRTDRGPTLAYCSWRHNYHPLPHNKESRFGFIFLCAYFFHAWDVAMESVGGSKRFAIWGLGRLGTTKVQVVEVKLVSPYDMYGFKAKRWKRSKLIKWRRKSGGLDWSGVDYQGQSMTGAGMGGGDTLFIWRAAAAHWREWASAFAFVGGSFPLSPPSFSHCSLSLPSSFSASSSFFGFTA